jgi:phosphatidate cytidylyltransferase
MLVRIISGLVALPLLAFIVIKGGIYLEVAVALITAIGLYEFYTALKAKYKPIKFPSIMMVILLHYLYRESMFLYFKSGLVLYIVLLLVLYVSQEKYKIQDIAMTTFGMLYIGLLLYHVVLFTTLPSYFYIGFIFIVSWGADTGAYFVGSFFGKRKLSPIISPNKSVEGAIGGMLMASILSVLWSLYFEPSFLVFSILLAVVGSIISIFGDLVASKIKREIGLKDYGKIMPGHGGVMDRFDSLILVTPVVYYMIVFYLVFVKSLIV